MIVCIYQLLNLYNGKFYIGHTVNFYNRCKTHISKLNRNEHPNKYLQNAWNLYGKENFEFIIIEVCKKEEMAEREQFWIDSLKACDRQVGYNINPKASSSLGYRHTPETLAKMSAIMLAMGNKPPSALGRKATPETIAKLKLALTGIKKSNTDKMKKPKSEAHKEALSKARTGFKHSDNDKSARSLAAKAKSTWLCADGNKCKCDWCRIRRNKYYRDREQRLKRNEN